MTIKKIEYWKKRLGIKTIKTKVLKTESLDDFIKRGNQIVKINKDPTPAGFVQSHKICQQFYKSREWIELRRQFKRSKEHTNQCTKCGVEVADIVQMDPNKLRKRPVKQSNVDHIWPIKYYWHLRLDPANLQFLCDDCNQCKENSHPRTRMSIEGFHL